MAGLIRRSDIDEVRSRTNLADIVGDYVALKSAGSGSMKGLCPFHEERSPSFHVRPQVGFYHCFGCGEGGDVFTFLQRMDHVSFSEAVERLAGRISYELHYEDGGAATDHGNRARILAANQAASDFFVAQLATPEAEPGRNFLGERGFDQSAAERFVIGFAPRGGALTRHLSTLGFTSDELVIAGLIGKGERGDFYDRFRGRLVWPIRDVTGQTLGFGARRLLDDDKGPKYLNTPETPVYHKSQVLYGLDLAKKDISRGKQIVVVEGYTDVMACHLAGVTTAVATCGTAFGVDHIKIVRRMIGDYDNADTTATGEVIFTFDPDEAGQNAANRAFAEEHRFAAQTFVAVAPDGLDPCDLRLKKGDGAVRRLVSTRKPMFEFKIRRELAVHDLETVEGRVAALRAAAPVVAGIRDQALGIGYVRSVAGWLGMDPSDVQSAVTSAKRQVPASSHAPTSSSAGSGAGSGMRSGSESGGGSGSGGAVTEVPEQRGPSIMSLKTDATTRLERDALMAVLQHPDIVGDELIQKLTQISFADSTLSVVRDAIASQVERALLPGWASAVADEVPQSFATFVKQLSVAPIPEREDRIPVYCVQVTTDLVERDLLRQKRELLGVLQRMDRESDPAVYVQTQRDLMRIEAERRALRDD
ncbi:DNA primase [Rhodoglobus vestalii]|uniref:DNA primase n=1 Tax=Rhodoglobus vestalii TaxID=193384 RepID=A0A8H2KBF5_9MICO|nr:DNA primase [Rhodoglobus vestalii]TQO21131.1 DNA primase [Rhodoglobus vestalii]